MQLSSKLFVLYFYMSMSCFSESSKGHLLPHRCHGAAVVGMVANWHWHGPCCGISSPHLLLLSSFLAWQWQPGHGRGKKLSTPIRTGPAQSGSAMFYADQSRREQRGFCDFVRAGFGRCWNLGVLVLQSRDGCEWQKTSTTSHQMRRSQDVPCVDWPLSAWCLEQNSTKL